MDMLPSDQCGVRIGRGQQLNMFRHQARPARSHLPVGALLCRGVAIDSEQLGRCVS